MANDQLNNAPSDILDHLRRIKQAQRAIRQGADAVIGSADATPLPPANLLDTASRARIESLRSKLNADARSDVLEFAEDCGTVVGDFHRQVVADCQRAAQVVSALRNLPQETKTTRVVIEGESSRVQQET